MSALTGRTILLELKTFLEWCGSLLLDGFGAVVPWEI
jgi:hypothetical protein